MYYLFNVYKEPNEYFLKMSFESYFENKNSTSLMYLLKNALAFALSFTTIEEIDLEFKDFGNIWAYGFYKDNLISINKKILNKAEDEDCLPFALFTLYHELCHAVLIKRNIEVFENKKYSELFIPNYDIEGMQKIFYKITKDKNLALGASQYFYLKNKNEQMAFLHGSNMAQKILNYFAEDKSLIVPSGKGILQSKMNYLKENFPFVVNNEQYFLDLLENYQLSILKKGLENITRDELLDFIKTTYVNISENTRVATLNACFNVNNAEIMAGVITNPMLVVTEREKQILSKVYGRKLIDQLTFEDSFGDLFKLKS